MNRTKKALLAAASLCTIVGIHHAAHNSPQLEEYHSLQSKNYDHKLTTSESARFEELQSQYRPYEYGMALFALLLGSFPMAWVQYHSWKQTSFTDS